MRVSGSVRKCDEQSVRSDHPLVVAEQVRNARTLHVLRRASRLVEPLPIHDREQSKGGDRSCRCRHASMLPQCAPKNAILAPVRNVVGAATVVDGLLLPIASAVGGALAPV